MTTQRKMTDEEAREMIRRHRERIQPEQMPSPARFDTVAYALSFTFCTLEEMRRVNASLRQSWRWGAGMTDEWITLINK